MIREVDQGRALGLDLRAPVVEAIENGLSHREAARRFMVGIATAGAWHRPWRRTGSVAPARQGHPPRSKLDPHEGFIRGLVADKADVTLAAIAGRLRGERGVKTCPSTVWPLLRQAGPRGAAFAAARPGRSAHES